MMLSTKSNTTTATAPLPDAVVRAVRAISKPFLALQTARYASREGATARALAESLVLPSLVMRTKTTLPSTNGSYGDAGQPVLLSTWSELYRVAADTGVDDHAQQVWGLVSTVLSLIEQGEAGGRGNASAAVVAWHARYSTSLDDLPDVLEDLQQMHPSMLTEEEMEDMGSSVLGRIEDAFLTGHFEAAAALVDAMLLFLRRATAPLLSAEVETALADVKRLLTVSFHDAETHQQEWVEGANAQLQESRNILVNPSGAPARSRSQTGGHRRPVDRLVEDLCATCLDMLLLATHDARRLMQRCRESKRSAVDFLVAICAVMEPFAELPRVADIFAQYVREWAGDLPRQWLYACVQAVLQVSSAEAMLEAMQAVTAVAQREFSWDSAAEARAGTTAETYTEDEEKDDEVDDTVGPEAIQAGEVRASPAQARRFTLACMAAHVGDLCAPAVVAATANAMPSTFVRNDLISSYAELVAFDNRTWRVAGVYACYSPFLNPRFLADVVAAAAVHAATSTIAYRDTAAFLRTSWDPRSVHQATLRGKLHAALPANTAVNKWELAMDYYYRTAVTELNTYCIATALNAGDYARAAWLAVSSATPDLVSAHLRQLLRRPDALMNAELYAIGAAVHHGFVAVTAAEEESNGAEEGSKAEVDVDEEEEREATQKATAQLQLHLALAAALAAYRNAATAVQAALSCLPESGGGGGAGAASSSPSSPRPISLAAAGPTIEATAELVVLCVHRIESALRAADACGDMLLHPSTIFSLVEHAAALLLSLRRLLSDPVTGESAATAHVASFVLPQLVEACELASIQGAVADPRLVERCQELGERLAVVHQTCI